MTTPPRDADADDGSVDVEAAWADIVARWDTDVPRAEPVAPADTVPADTVPADTARDTDDSDMAWAGPTSHVGGEAARAAGHESAEPDDDRYVPPEPPPLPRGDAVSRLAWGGVLGAPLFLVLSMLFWRGVPTLLVVAAIAAFVAGFVTLVVRMPDGQDDADDGAVV